LTTSLAAKEHFLGERSILIPLLARGEALLALRMQLEAGDGAFSAGAA